MSHKDVILDEQDVKETDLESKRSSRKTLGCGIAMIWLILSFHNLS